MTDFPEHVSLQKNFETVKVKRVKVTVIPMQNISNNSTSVMLPYVMSPWHYPIAAPQTFNAYLSSDKAKVFRGTQIGSQTYVPSMMVINKINSTVAGAVLDQLIWRPELRTVTTSDPPGKAPLIWSGIIAWQGDPEVGAGKAHFDIKMDVWVTYKNQTNMNV